MFFYIPAYPISFFIACFVIWKLLKFLIKQGETVKNKEEYINDISIKLNESPIVKSENIDL